MFEHSKRRWNKRRDEAGAASYDKKGHKDWIDEKNKGVSHFGINPACLPQHNLQFGAFHMKCSIIKRLTQYSREFIINQLVDIITLFAKLLSKIWNDFHMVIWQNNNNKFVFPGIKYYHFSSDTSQILLNS